MRALPLGSPPPPQPEPTPSRGHDHFQERHRNHFQIKEWFLRETETDFLWPFTCEFRSLGGFMFVFSLFPGENWGFP